MGFLSDLFYLAAGIAVGCQEAAKELPIQAKASHDMNKEYLAMSDALARRNAMALADHPDLADTNHELAVKHQLAFIEARNVWDSCGGTFGGNKIPNPHGIPSEPFPNVWR